MGGYGKQFRQEGRASYEIENTDEWHYFGLDWQPDGYVFYYDGKEVSRATENVSHVPEFLLLTTEVKGYRKDVPVAVGEKFVDDAFIVDFVRVYDKIG